MKLKFLLILRLSSFVIAFIFGFKPLLNGKWLFFASLILVSIICHIIYIKIKPEIKKEP